MFKHERNQITTNKNIQNLIILQLDYAESNMLGTFSSSLKTLNLLEKVLTPLGHVRTLT